MSDQFYSYLSEKTNDFFRMNPLIPGSKYNIQFETEDQARALYESARNNSFVSSYEYKDNEGKTKYDSYQIDFNGVQLIVAATINDVQPDFLTRLRNMVGVEPGYERKAILFIHNTTLDSIMGGTESFAKEGMPFHIDSIQKDIRAKVSISSFSKVEKEIINLDLERKKNALFQDNNSIFEYREVLDILNKGCINREQYKILGCFMI
ncbi:MAG: hypothetical protein ACLTYB_14670 [Clostridium paraputrificum]